MNARRRLITAAAAAFVVSGGATLALSWRMARVSAAESSRMRTYVAPLHLVAAGEPLQIADLHLISWPAGSPVTDAVEHMDDAIGRTALYPVAPGQPLLEHDLTPRGAGPGLAGRIPAGMRALAVKSDEVVGVGGFLSPGLHVDMLVTLRKDGTGPETSTVLQDAEVIAVGQQSEPDPTGKPTTATVVTLLVTPDQAQRAMLSTNQGTVNFILRNSADRTNLTNVPVTLADLGSAVARPVTAVPVQATPRAPKPRVPKASLPVLPSMPEVVLNSRGAKEGTR